MEYKLIDPLLPSIKRWFGLKSKYGNLSTLRFLEYEKLFGLELKGKVFDLGGGDNAKYKPKLKGDFEYSSANIDPDIAPTWLVKPGDKLPIKAGQFDICITMNTLEHVYDPHFLIKEIHRVLKKGGTVHISVPWMFRIHGHPDDYNRLTPSWWKQAMTEAGFSSTEVTPLIWGRKSTARSFSGSNGLFKSLQNHWVHIYDCIYAFACFRGTERRYSGRRGQRICNVALGHFISATK